MEGREHFLNSLWLENWFNALRDNEARGARHKQRTDIRLQGLEISAMATRLGNAPERLISVADDDVSKYDGYTPLEARFRAKDAQRDDLGVDVGKIHTKSEWSSTKPHLFVLNLLALFEALRVEENEDDWQYLWLAQLLRPNMILERDGKMYYVLMHTYWTFSLFEMKAVGPDFPNMWEFVADAALLRPIVTLTSLDR